MKRPGNRRSTRLRSVRGLVAGLVLCVGVVPGAWAGDWEDMQDRLDEKMRTHAKRVEEIDAREHGDPADPVARAEKITRDRIARSNALLNRGVKLRALASAAEAGATDPRALAEVSSEQAALLEAATREWGSAGPERRKVREALAAAQKNLERTNANLAQASGVADATRTRVAESGVSQAIARIESGASEAGERLRARWQREWDARERERLFRERAAAERERGVR